ncbi:MAG: hypothetical protein ACYDIE_01925 [Candidatus Krumholzibacteriia bacterium]
MRHRMRHLLIALPLLLCVAAAAHAEVSVRIGLPGVDIGVNMPSYPRLVLVPGMPVYYDPQVNSNYFFYDGMYWVYSGDNWYASSWYNGPWDLVSPDDMPLFVLRVPVRYYRQPPSYFSGWRNDAPPRWDEHWGRDWHARQDGWDRWNRKSAPRPAPLPTYQRKYAGRSYPGAADQQGSLRSRHYRYKPREAVARQHYAAPPDRGRQDKQGPPDKGRQGQSGPQDKGHQDKGHQDKNARGGRGKG